MAGFQQKLSIVSSIVTIVMFEKNIPEVIEMNKKTIFGLFALAIVGMILSTTMVNAYRGDYTETGPYCDDDRHELMEQAFENDDYAAWAELMAENGVNSRVMSVVNEDNFETFVQAHEAGTNGDYELASQLRSELGLNNGQGLKDGAGHKQGLGVGNSEQGSKGMGRY